MYIPAHFAAGDEDEIAAFVEQAGSADLVTFDGTKPVATLMPVTWDRSAGGNGRLLAHLARANPQWSTAVPEVPGLAMVRGPQAYVSPSWYAGPKEQNRAVPTWNYTAVHFTGPVTFHTDPGWLRDVVTALTERYEHDLDNRWWVTDAPEAYIEAQLRGIVGVEMLITGVEAKAKLSQNRSPADRAGVIAALRAAADPQAQQIARLMTEREASKIG